MAGDKPGSRDLRKGAWLRETSSATAQEVVPTLKADVADDDRKYLECPQNQAVRMSVERLDGSCHCYLSFGEVFTSRTSTFQTQSGYSL